MKIGDLVTYKNSRLMDNFGVIVGVDHKARSVYEDSLYVTKYELD